MAQLGPPTSRVMSASSPTSAPSLCPPITPAAGPERKRRTGRALATVAWARPPRDCMTCSGASGFKYPEEQFPLRHLGKAGRRELKLGFQIHLDEIMSFQSFLVCEKRFVIFFLTVGAISVVKYSDTFLDTSPKVETIIFLACAVKAALA